MTSMQDWCELIAERVGEATGCRITAREVYEHNSHGELFNLWTWYPLALMASGRWDDLEALGGSHAAYVSKLRAAAPQEEPEKWWAYARAQTWWDLVREIARAVKNDELRTMIRASCQVGLWLGPDGCANARPVRFIVHHWLGGLSHFHASLGR